MLFDRLVTGQVVSMNPAAAVPRLNHVVNTGKAPVLEAFFGRITALKMRVDVHS